MFLSRIELSPRAPEQERFWREVSKPYGAHQALWGLFSRAPEQPRDFLFRAEEATARPSFLVLSAEPPAGDGHGLWRVESKPFAPALDAGQRLGFRLRASPVVRRTPRGAVGTRGRRHDVVMDRTVRLRAEGKASPHPAVLVREAGLAWLAAQGTRSGFHLVRQETEEIGGDGLLAPGEASEPAVRVDGYRQHRVVRKGEAPIRFSTLDFEGVLEVTDPEVFVSRIRVGFGPQKAFGCGLMLLRRM